MTNKKVKCYYCNIKTDKEYQIMWDGDESGNPERWHICEKHADLFSGEKINKRGNLVKRLVDLGFEVADCISDNDLDRDETAHYVAGIISGVVANVMDGRKI